MKKVLSMALLVFFSHAVFAQADTTKDGKPKMTYTSLNLKNRANDHFMIEFSYDNWVGKTDSMNTSGFSRGFAMYFMFDFPFKTNPHLSMAFGPGIATDHMLFTKTHLGIKDNTTAIYFTDQSDTNNFKKTKLATAFLEAPKEFRYTADPYTG